MKEVFYTFVLQINFKKHRDVDWYPFCLGDTACSHNLSIIYFFYSSRYWYSGSLFCEWSGYFPGTGGPSGEKIVLITGGILTGLTVLIASMAKSFEALLLLLLVIGFWTASGTPAGSKGIMSWFPEKSRGFALGFRQIGQPVGGSLAALILPALALTYGWHGALVRASISAFAGALLVMFFYKEKTEEKN